MTVDVYTQARLDGLSDVEARALSEYAPTAQEAAFATCVVECAQHGVDMDYIAEQIERTYAALDTYLQIYDACCWLEENT